MSTRATSVPSHHGPLPMRVDVRLWDLEYALVLDDPSFQVARESSVGRRSQLPLESNGDVEASVIADRKRPVLSLEVRFDQQVAAESQLHVTDASTANAASSTDATVVDWKHSPLRSYAVRCQLREAFVFSVHPSALEGAVQFSLFQWAPLHGDGPAETESKPSVDGSLTHDPLSETMADTFRSVSEQDDSEQKQHDAAYKICIGWARVPLRSVLGDQQLRVRLQLHKRLRREVLNLPSDATDALLGSRRGGVAALTLHVSAFFPECLVPPEEETMASMQHVPPAAGAAAAPNGLVYSARGERNDVGRSLSIGSTRTQATSMYRPSLVGLDCLEVRLLLTPLCAVTDAVTFALDLMLWRRASATLAALGCIALTVWYGHYAVTGVVWVVAWSIRARRSMMEALDAPVPTAPPKKVLLYPPQYALLNTLIRGDMWLQVGHSDEAFLEVMRLIRASSVHTPTLFLALWGGAMVYALVPLPMLLVVGTVAAFVATPLLLRFPMFSCSIRRRQRKAVNRPGTQINPVDTAYTSLRVGSWELVWPQAWTRARLPVTRVVRAQVARLCEAPSPNIRIDGHSEMRTGFSTSSVDYPAAITAPSTPEATAPLVDHRDGHAAGGGRGDVLKPSTAGVAGNGTGHGPGNGLTLGTPQMGPIPEIEVSPDSQHFNTMLDHHSNPAQEGPRVPMLPLQRRSSLMAGDLQDLPPAPPLSARAKRRESDGSASRMSSEQMQTPRARPQQSKLLTDDPPVGIRRHHSANIGALVMHNSAHKRTHSQLVAAGPSLSFAIVTVEWKDDHAHDPNSMRSLYHNSGTTDMVKERIRQFYRKVEAAEQRIAAERLASTAGPIDSTGSVGSVGTSTGPVASPQGSSSVHDHVASEATLLLLYLRRMWRSAVVHVSTACVTPLEAAAANVERLERVAHPGSLVEHISTDQVTTTLLSGFAPLPILRLPESKGLDENCRAWALIGMCFLNGRRLSMYAPHGTAKTTFLVPLAPHSLVFESTSGTGSCPPPLLPALQDLWRGWQEGGNRPREAHAPLVTMDMILTIVSSHREYWKHHTPASSSSLTAAGTTNLATPRASAANVAASAVAMPRRKEASKGSTASPPQPSRGDGNQRMASDDDGATSPTPGLSNQPTPKPQLQLQPTQHRPPMLSPIDLTVNGNASNRYSPATNHLAADTSGPFHNLDGNLSSFQSTSFESATPSESVPTSQRHHRNVYESLGLQSQKKTRAVEDPLGGAAHPSVRGMSPPPPKSPQRMEPFPSWHDANSTNKSFSN